MGKTHNTFWEIADGESRRLVLVRRLLFLEVARSKHGGAIVRIEKHVGKELLYHQRRVEGATLFNLIPELYYELARNLLHEGLLEETPEFEVDVETVAFLMNALMDFTPKPIGRPNVL